MGKYSQFIQPQHVSKFTSIFHLVWNMLLASYLFFVWSYYSFKLFAFNINIHQQFCKYLKVQEIMDQHNFEMIHFICINSAIQCIIPVLLCYVEEWFDLGI